MIKNNIITCVNNLEAGADIIKKEAPATHSLTNEAFANHIANSVLQAMQEFPGQSYIGRTVVKHRILQPADEEQLRAKFRAIIAKKFFEKWKC